MQIRQAIRNAIASVTGAHFATQDTSLPQDEALWSHSAIYSMSDFNRYNPDDLIGRKGYDIYGKMLREDEQLKAVVRFRRNAVTGRKTYFEFEDKDKEALSDKEQAFRIDLFNTILEKLPGSFHQRLNGIMTSMSYGFSVTEKVFQPLELEEGTYWGLKVLRTKPYHSFSFPTDEYGNLQTIVQEMEGDEQQIDPDTVIHHVHNSDVDENYGQSELREAYRSWFDKDIIKKFRNIHLERTAGGFLALTQVGDKNIASGTAEHTAIQNILRNITASTGILLPKGVEAQVIQSTGTEAFDSAIISCDKGIAKALLMPNMLGLSETGSGGSRALGDTQLEAFLWVLDNEANDLEETLNEQLFKQLGEVNFADGLYPRFRFRPLSQGMVSKIATAWGDLIQKGAVTATDTDEDYLREIMGFPEKGEPREKVPSEDEEGGPGGQDPERVGDDTDGDTDGDDDSDVPDETIIGQDQAAIKYDKAQFNRAKRRVDFAAIDDSSETLQWQGENTLSLAINELLASTITDVRTRGLGVAGSDPKDIAALKPNSQAMSSLRKAAKEILRNGWTLGTRHAKREVAKAGKETTKQMNAKFEALGDIALRYFDSKSFSVAGILTTDSLEIVKQSLYNGIKYSKPIDDTVKDIYASFASKGLLSEETARELLGEALDVDNPDHRLRTVVRTNTFEAINEARFEYFTSEDIDGFVTKLEYSAILDSRTTDICSHLDGKVYLLNSDEWEKYRPPNHFNCRSILIPVTEFDEVATTTEPPTVSPQQGFFSK